MFKKIKRRINIPVVLMFLALVVFWTLVGIGLNKVSAVDQEIREIMEDTYKEWEYKEYCHNLCEEMEVPEQVVLGIIWNESRFIGGLVGENGNN